MFWSKLVSFFFEYFLVGGVKFNHQVSERFKKKQRSSGLSWIFQWFMGFSIDSIEKRFHLKPPIKTNWPVCRHLSHISGVSQVHRHGEFTPPKVYWQQFGPSNWGRLIVWSFLVCRFHSWTNLPTIRAFKFYWITILEKNIKYHKILEKIPPILGDLFLAGDA